MFIYEVKKDDKLVGRFRDFGHTVHLYNRLINEFGSDSVKIEFYEQLDQFQEEEITIKLTRDEISYLLFYLARNTQSRKKESQELLNFAKDEESGIIFSYRAYENGIYMQREEEVLRSIIEKIKNY